MRALAFILLLWAGSVSAGDLFRGRLLNPNQLHEQGEFSPRLYDARTQQLAASNGAYLPDRVYSVFHQGEKKWVYARTTHWGKFPEPFEFFYPGSMVEGKEVGAEYPLAHFILTKKYEWEQTPSPFRQQLILVLAEPPFFKRVQWYRHDPPKSNAK